MQTPEPAVAFSCDHEGDPPATGRGRATPHGSAGSGEGADKPAATSSPEKEITAASVYESAQRIVADDGEWTKGDALACAP